MAGEPSPRGFPGFDPRFLQRGDGAAGAWVSRSSPQERHFWSKYAQVSLLFSLREEYAKAKKGVKVLVALPGSSSSLLLRSGFASRHPGWLGSLLR